MLGICNGCRLASGTSVDMCKRLLHNLVSLRRVADSIITPVAQAYPLHEFLITQYYEVSTTIIHVQP